MWVAWVVAGIALAAAAFMIRFLIALLREKAPSVSYWIIPVRGRPEQTRHLQVLSRIYVDEDSRAQEGKHGDSDGDSLENENYAKEDGDSGLIALDVPPIGGLGWGSIHSGRGSTFSG
jgi:hypothetical protein